MNEDDKKRFARYRPGYIETEDNEDEIVKKKTSEEAATKLGFVDQINIDSDDLISQVIREIEEKSINEQSETQFTDLDLSNLNDISNITDLKKIKTKDKTKSINL
jgi:hypothetical protein